MGTDLGQDLEGTEVLLREFLGGPSCSKVLGSDIYEQTVQEFRGRDSVLISILPGSVLGFGHLLPEVVLQFLQVDSKISGSVGCHVVLGVDGKVRVVTFVSEKGANNCGGTRGVVVSKLGKW